MLKPTLRAAHHKPLTILSHISLYWVTSNNTGDSEVRCDRKNHEKMDIFIQTLICWCLGIITSKCSASELCFK
jgi:hypothetical protein